MATAPGWAQPTQPPPTTDNQFNPALSLNALFLGDWRDPSDAEDGFRAQELELALTSVVDPYFKAKAYVALEPEEEGTEVALEEAYADFTALPRGFGARAGQFFVPLGRHNRLHTHAFPFIEAPLAVRDLLGEESAADVGVKLGYLPSAPWYINLEAFLLDGQADWFYERNSLAGGARVESLWELSEGGTLDASLSLADGPAESGRRRLVAAEMRYKWQDVRKTHGKNFVWLVELLVDTADGVRPRTGVHTLARWRAARRWWVSGGYSAVEAAGTSGDLSHEVRGQLTFAPSEFSAVRLEAGRTDPHGAPRALFATIQLNFTIGAHPAHEY